VPQSIFHINKLAGCRLSSVRDDEPIYAHGGKIDSSSAKEHRHSDSHQKTVAVTDDTSDLLRETWVNSRKNMVTILRPLTGAVKAKKLNLNMAQTLWFYCMPFIKDQLELPQRSYKNKAMDRINCHQCH
jgi:hypothetical protein